MRNLLSKEIQQTAANWAKTRGVPKEHEFDLLADLNETLERLGVSFKPGRITREQRKEQIINMIKTGVSNSGRKIAKLMGYQSNRFVVILLNELQVEGRVSYSQEKGWTLNETEN